MGEVCCVLQCFNKLYRKEKVLITMNIYEGKLKFQGTFRSYQQRVLDRSATYLKDKKYISLLHLDQAKQLWASN